MSLDGKIGIEEKKTIIQELLNMQNALFNPARCPDGDMDFQYTFREEEGNIVFHLSVRDRKSIVKPGPAQNPICDIITDLAAMQDISGGYLSPLQAVRQKQFRIRSRNPFSSRLVRRLYCGSTRWDMPNTLYKGTFPIQSIKKVLVLNCSPRCERGATAVLTERFIKGMERAGAEVETLFPARMKINPCIGCFQCWVNSSDCIYHARDDMRLILERYWSCDMVVWATPIYHYHGTTSMKTVMDRLFINADPHFMEVDGQYRHPRKHERIPAYSVLAVGGFPDMNIFSPLRSNFQALSDHTGIQLLGELYRHTSMIFTLDDVKMKKKDEALEAFERAGEELIRTNGIARRTRTAAEQAITTVPILASMVNMKMDIMQKEKRMPFQRKACSEQEGEMI